jgi:cell division protein FtsB
MELSFRRNGLVDLLKMRIERDKSAASLQDLRGKNRLLASEIRRLMEDPKYFESVARRELGLVLENEIIFRIKENERGVVKRPIHGK